ncbi:hypothetical protein SKAU_G00046880 [Synaphobranchus kaupii]|uniref:Fibrinogen C-terminal domain-containing protein n=1 Tax=Synaphobranchus kaupii TaxID=118154 RepID=A0A9Q1G272_SYNKA|nr:hypothetical protein SKAU_G00046880 [Synaphobranchus kaupii]
MDGGWNPTGCSRLVLLLFLNVHIGQVLITHAGSPVTVLGTDCTQISKINPGATSGLHTIKPEGIKKDFKVYCEMRLDGCWTVFQRRTGGAVSFQRNWAAYKAGFGKREADHWLGLWKLWAITKGEKWVLRVELCDFEGGTVYAEYRGFNVGSVKDNFKLSVGDYSGTAGDGIHGTLRESSQNSYGFTTKDRDHDGCTPCIADDIATDNCSLEKGKGGWWYSNCGSASLNGEWHPAGKNPGGGSGLHWHRWKGTSPYSYRATRMMIKPL